ncbi:MAG: DegT/DnrJ/EryC1/StrS family aminotransferase [Pseudohongiellaceae bacterium]
MLVSFLPVTKTKRTDCEDYSQEMSNLFYFQLGRQAMRAGLDLCDFKEGQVVLMPASLCPAVIEPFSNFGLNIKLYGLDRGFQWDVDDIRDQITSDTVAIYVIHYFGISYDLSEIRGLCNDKNLILIEDCALAGFDQSSSIGTVGDVAIFSLWKFHPISDGAFLRVNKQFPLFSQFTNETSDFITSFTGQFKIYIKYLAVKGLIPFSFLKKLLKKNIVIQDDPPNDNFGERYDIFAMSSRTKKVFLGEDLQRCGAQRRENYNALHKFCVENKIPTLYSKITDDSIPYCFPVIVNDPIAIQNKMARDGIETEISINKPFANQTYLIQVEDQFPDLLHLADRVLSIPIHQNIGTSQIQHIKKSLLKYALNHYGGH